MEQKKSPQVDMEQRRTTGFLLGLVFVLAVFYVALEWNSTIDETPIDPLDLDELLHESELVPMSNEETVAQLVEKQPVEKAEQLNIVDDEVELEQSNEELTGEDEGADDETLLKELDEEQDKPLEAMGVDPNNPLNFHIVEDLPQFPGGAVEFMKWLTKHLHYPNSARIKKVQGTVKAVFYIEKTGKVTGIKITQPLSPECDREALRVLQQMPDWQPGIQNDKPCRTKVSIPIVFKL